MQGKALQEFTRQRESPSLSLIQYFQNPLDSKDFDRFDEMNSPELYLAALFNPCFPTLNWQGRFPFRLVNQTFGTLAVTEGQTKATTRTVRKERTCQFSNYSVDISLVMVLMMMAPRLSFIRSSWGLAIFSSSRLSSSVLISWGVSVTLLLKLISSCWERERREIC